MSTPSPTCPSRRPTSYAFRSPSLHLARPACPSSCASSPGPSWPRPASPSCSPALRESPSPCCLSCVARGPASGLQLTRIQAFGQLTNSFTGFQTSATLDPASISALGPALLDKVNDQLKLLFGIGAAVFFTTFVSVSVFSLNAENVSNRIREAYLAALLRQNIAYFDVRTPRLDVLQ